MLCCSRAARSCASEATTTFSMASASPATLSKSSISGSPSIILSRSSTAARPTTSITTSPSYLYLYFFDEDSNAGLLSKVDNAKLGKFVCGPISSRNARMVRLKKFLVIHEGRNDEMHLFCAQSDPLSQLDDDELDQGVGERSLQTGTFTS